MPWREVRVGSRCYLQGHKLCGPQRGKISSGMDLTEALYFALSCPVLQVKDNLSLHYTGQANEVSQLLKVLAKKGPWWSEFEPWDPQGGRRKPTVTIFPLTFIYSLLHTCAYTYTQINKTNQKLPYTKVCYEKERDDHWSLFYFFIF